MDFHCFFDFMCTFALFNFYDVVDGFLLRCRVSGIGSVSLFVSNMLTLDGSELFPLCICFFMIIRRVFVVELRVNRGHFVVGAAVFYSNNASVKLGGHQQQEHLGDTHPRRSSQTN